jgi:putative transcriptional regulator
LRYLCKEFFTRFSLHHRRASLSYEPKVRQYRERQGLSQEALARELGVSRQTIVNIEKGLSEPRVLLALAICAVLGGIAVSEMFKGGIK